MDNQVDQKQQQQQGRRAPVPARGRGDDGRQPQGCPRCNSPNTKFCYFNNYSLCQPRYFCKTCRRYWTKGGTLRNVPVGGGCRKRLKKSPSSSSSSSSLHDQLEAPPAGEYGSFLASLRQLPPLNQMINSSTSTTDHYGSAYLPLLQDYNNLQIEEQQQQMVHQQQVGQVLPTNFQEMFFNKEQMLSHGFPSSALGSPNLEYPPQDPSQIMSDISFWNPIFNNSGGCSSSARWLHGFPPHPPPPPPPPLI